MGWAGGSGMAYDIWKLFGKYIPANQKKLIARKLIDIFEDQDCDTLDECEELMKDACAVYDEYKGRVYK